MFVELDQSVKSRLQRYAANPELTILLNFDDGVGVYSKVQATCGLEVNFNLTIVNASADLIDFNDQVATSLGDFFVKGYSKEFLDTNNRLVQDSTGAIQLIGVNSGMIDNSVPIIDLSKEQQPPQTHLEKIDDIAN